MVRLLLLVLCCFSTPLFGQAIYKGQIYNAPVCSNPNCAMCNYIRAQLAVTAPLPSSAYDPAGPEDYYPGFPFTHEQTTVEYETVQVHYQVKRCNGVTCWYETAYRTERRPVRKAVKKVLDKLHITKLDPTPREAVTAMVALANVQPNEVLYDLGCGDGRILVAASYLYGCRSVGIELNPDTVKQAADNIDDYGLANKIKVVQGDILAFGSYPQANVVTMYLYPELIEKVLPRLPKGTRIISYLHSFTGSTKIELNGHTFYTRTL